MARKKGKSRSRRKSIKVKEREQEFASQINKLSSFSQRQKPTLRNNVLTNNEKEFIRNTLVLDQSVKLSKNKYVGEALRRSRMDDLNKINRRVCRSRQSRRRALFYLAKAGKGKGIKTPKRYNWTSNIRCR